MASSSRKPIEVLPRFIDNGSLEITSVIGTGAYGEVYLGIDHRYQPPQWRAVKCLRRFDLDERQKHFQRRELELHRFASGHPSIVRMFRTVVEGNYTYVVMEYGEEGDLFGMITEKQRYVGDDELIRDVFLQLLDGIIFLHSLGIAHRDIKPENVVCSEDGTRVRICDFGLATTETVSSEFGCGSTFYIAPECLGDWFPNNTKYPTRPGDVWSLGVILTNLACGRNPWRIASKTDESFNAYLKDPDFLRRILPISLECQEVLERIFTLDPAHRISLSELREMIENVETFSMTEEELVLAHAAAAAATATAAVAASAPTTPMDESYWADESIPFEFEQHHRASFEQQDGDGTETPSLRADSGSPSPGHLRSRSGSSVGGESLPPTPLLGAGAGAETESLRSHDVFWDLRKNPHEQQGQLRINPTSPDSVSASAPNPFFR